MTTIESTPERFGLRIVKRVDVADAYEFDTILVLQDVETERLYAGRDHGCSCPLPFDDVGRDSLTAIATRADLDAYARSQWADCYMIDRFDSLDAAVAELVSFEWPAGTDHTAGGR